MAAKSLMVAAEVICTVIVMALSGITPIHLPGIAIPLTLQSMCAIGLPLVLGGRNASIGMLLFLLLAALGAPILAGGSGGFSYFLSPSSGYLIGFLLAAVLSAYFKPKMQSPRYLRIFILFIALHLVITITGLFGVVISGAGPIEWSKHVDPFLPGLVAKSILGMLIIASIDQSLKLLRKSTV